LITLEGIEGTGKTTQAGRLAEWLKKRGIEAVVTREPGGTALGGRLRALLMDNNPGADLAGTGNFAEALLFLADRADHSGRVLIPHLLNDRIVVCDRYWHSTMVYQGVLVGGPAFDWVVKAQMDLAKAMEEMLGFDRGEKRGLLRPDLTLIFDMDPAAALSRLVHRGGVPRTRFDDKPLSYHARARGAFLRLAHGNIGAARLVVIDAGKSEDLVAAAVQAKVWEQLENMGMRPREVVDGHR